MASTEIEFQTARPSRTGLAGKWDGLKLFCYNPVTKAYCGRTCESWGKITGFYLVYYALLAAFCAIMMTIFFTTIEQDSPKQQGMHSLIKGNPGLGFRPMPDVESTLIKFKTGQPDTFKEYIDSMKDFLKVYKSEAIDKEGPTVDCSNGRPEGATDPCKFDMGMLGDWCTEENNFGFYEGEPCIILKMNKVFGWEPELYSNDTKPEIIANSWTDDHLPVSCEGEEYATEDNIGQVQFYPPGGFPKAFYPYQKQKGYRAPLVMARFKTPTQGQLLQLWCKVWADNIYHHKNDKAGSTHFEILIN